MNDIIKIKENIQNMKVLYVEDEEKVRESTANFLNKFFNNLTIANDGEDGLEKFKKTLDMDIVVTDVNMPKLNGIKMIELIKELKKDIIVVFISADDEINSVSEYDNCYILKKPVQIENVIEIFKKIAFKSF